MKCLNLVAQDVEKTSDKGQELSNLYQEISRLRDQLQSNWLLPKNSATLAAAKVVKNWLEPSRKDQAAKQRQVYDKQTDQQSVSNNDSKLLRNSQRR